VFGRSNGGAVSDRPHVSAVTAGSSKSEARNIAFSRYHSEVKSHFAQTKAVPQSGEEKPPLDARNLAATMSPGLGTVDAFRTGNSPKGIEPHVDSLT
jgi:hypothetical protein